MFKNLNLFSFAFKLDKIKSSFSKALDSAKKLESEMDKTISEKNEKITKLQDEINETNEIKSQTSVFIKNLSNLLGL